MQLDPTLIAQINEGTIGADGTTPTGTAEFGDDAPAIALAVSNDSYADPSASLDLSPVVSTGYGDSGTLGLNGKSFEAQKSGIDLTYPDAGAGQAGGDSGVGGAAELDMDNDVFGTTATPLGGGTMVMGAWPGVRLIVSGSGVSTTTTGWAPVGATKVSPDPRSKVPKPEMALLAEPSTAPPPAT